MPFVGIGEWQPGLVLDCDCFEDQRKTNGMAVGGTVHLLVRWPGADEFDYLAFPLGATFEQYLVRGARASVCNG